MFDLRTVAALHVNVLRDVTQHVGEDVVEVSTAHRIVDVRLVSRLHGLEIQSMQIRVVKKSRSIRQTSRYICFPSARRSTATSPIRPGSCLDRSVSRPLPNAAAPLGGPPHGTWFIKSVDALGKPPDPKAESDGG